MPIIVKDPNLLTDTLACMKPDNTPSDDYARGLVVGVVSAIMALTGESFESVMHLMQDAAPSLPVSVLKRRVPPSYVGYLIK